MNLFWAMLLKPFVALVVFFFVFLIAGAVHRYMPDGKLKRVLFSPLPGHKRRRWD
jgi:hypothetical protein